MYNVKILKRRLHLEYGVHSFKWISIAISHMDESALLKTFSNNKAFDHEMNCKNSYQAKIKLKA